MAKSKRIASVDIGSTKVVCVVADIDSTGRIEIAGHGTAPPEGFRAGVVVSLEKATESVNAAMDAASRAAGGKLHGCPVYIGVTGEHIKHMSGLGTVPVNRPTRIQPRDVDAVIRQAQTIRLPNDELILHVLPTQFIIDGQKGVRNPLGLFGVRLEVEALLIIGAVTAIENIYRVMERLELRNRSLILQSLATSVAVCEPEDKDLGVAVVDLGGVTDVSVYSEGEIRFTKMLPVGATNITKDIAVGLRTPFAHAEEIKKAHGTALASTVERDEPLAVEDASGRGQKQVSRRLLASIIEPRAEELLNLAEAEVRKSGFAESLSAGVILAGGGALLPGIDILAEQVFGKPVRIGRPNKVNGPREVTGNPAYATAVGLVQCASEGRYHHMHRLSSYGLIRELWHDFKEWFS